MHAARGLDVTDLDRVEVVVEDEFVETGGQLGRKLRLLLQTCNTRTILLYFVADVNSLNLLHHDWFCAPG